MTVEGRDTGIIEHALIIDLEHAAVAEVLGGADNDDDQILLVSHAAMAAGRKCLETITERREFVFEGRRYSVSEV